MARLSGAAVLLILVVPLFMYTFALFVGIQLGRALERNPDSVNVVSVKGIVQFFAEELQRGRDFVGHERVLWIARPAPASPRAVGRYIGPNHVYSRPKIDDLEISERNITPTARSYNRNHTSPRGVISVGPWGGSGGQPFYMRGLSPPRLHSIILYHSSVIHSLACEYSLADNMEVNHKAGTWGLPHSFGSTAVRATINLSVEEHVISVEGTIGRFGSVPNSVITSLRFRTNTGRTYGPYGSESGTSFSIPAASGCIAGFWGRSGWLIDAIGVYIRQCPAKTRLQG
ncbi:hypothetical protein QOZ80_9AG0672920 [Eleusine coracana subsp. coracana]|nr:hypothetical protein QOZ80_9AG0672920 [Eleusine coracana subsp. coracana]